MQTIELDGKLLRSAHEFLEGTMADVTAEQLAWDPPGRAFSIAANYAHVLTSEDLGIQGLLKRAEPLILTTWKGRAGMSEAPPMGPGGDLKDWSRRAEIDLPALRAYGRAVSAATDDYLAGLTPEALGKTVDLSAFGFGQQPMFFVLNALLANVSLHCGEISCLKGIQGLKGYPV